MYIAVSNTIIKYTERTLRAPLPRRMNSRSVSETNVVGP